MIKKYLTLMFLALSNSSFGMEQAIGQTPGEREHGLEQLWKDPSSCVSTLPRELITKLQHFVNDQIRQVIESSTSLQEAIGELKKLADLKIHARYFKSLRSFESIINALALRFEKCPGNIAKQLEIKGFEEAMRWVQEIRPSQLELFDAIWQGNMDAIKQLIAQHVSPNARGGIERETYLMVTPQGETPLIIAAQEGLLDIAQYLLEHGADINAQTSSGSTALMHAVYKNNTDIVKLLLDHGADPNIKDIRCKTALINAVYSDNPDIVKLLLASTASPYLEDELGRTALHLAQLESNQEIIQLLKDAMDK